MPPRRSARPATPTSPGGTPTPVAKQLDRELKRQVELEAELADVRDRVSFLRRRVAVAAFQAAVSSDVVAQKINADLEAALLSFTNSLQSPPGYDAAEDGDYEDTDEFGDARVLDEAVDAALSATMSLLQMACDSAEFNTGMLQLLCVTHFVARCSELVDDKALSGLQSDVMEDLRQDVTQLWYEVADRLHNEFSSTDPVQMNQWLQSALGVLVDDCGEYYQAAGDLLRTVGSPNYTSKASDE